MIDDRKARIIELRQRLQSGLAKRARRQPNQSGGPAPRYDDVFWDGVDWLNDQLSETQHSE